MIKDETIKQMPRRRVVGLVLLAMMLAASLLLAPAAKPAQAAFPGQNGKIAFHSNSGGNLDIHSLNPDGSNLTSHTFGPFKETEPSVSPDGKQIAWARDAGDGSGFNIYVQPADEPPGVGEQFVVGSLKDDTQPSWSPDSKKIAFESNQDGNDEIYLVDTNGNNQKRLTFDQRSDGAPAFSPDGKKIAFQSNRDGNLEIYVMNALDGSNQTRLTKNFTATDFLPAFSPDGKKIAFASFRDGNFNIYKMNADGSSQKRLTKNAATDTSPTWSPDGKKIAFVSRRDGIDEIYRMNAKDGSKQKRITVTTDPKVFFNGSPDWGVATQQ